MKIIINKTVKMLEIHHQDEQINFIYDVWAKLRESPTESVFGILNNYMETLPKGIQNKLWIIYKRIHSELEEVSTLELLNASLAQLISEMYELIDYNHLHSWCRVNGNIYIDPEITDDFDTTKDRDMTFIRSECFDLSVYAVLVKLAAPVLGRYTLMIKEEMGADLKEFYSVKLLNCDSLTKLAPYKKLYAYSERLAEQQPDKPTALTTGLASYHLGPYAFSMAVVRRLTIASLCDTNESSVVSYVYKLVNQKLKTVGRDQHLKDKSATAGNRDGEQESLADQYRISQEVNDGISVTSECYLLNIDKVIHDLKLEDYSYQIKEVYNSLLANTSFEISDYHLVLSSFVLRHVLQYKTLQLVSREAVLSAIAVAAVAYHEAYPTVSKLMLAAKVRKDPEKMELGTTGGQLVKKLPNVVAAQLAEKYPYVTVTGRSSKNNNPGYELADSIATIVSTYDWVGLDNPEDIRLELAELIINN